MTTKTRLKGKLVNPKSKVQAKHDKSVKKAGADLVKAFAKVTDAAPGRFTTIRPPPTGASPAGWHEHSSFLECPKKYQLANVWKIRKPQLMTADPLAVGSLFHAGRAHWFQSGFPTGADYWGQAMDYVRDAALRMELPVRDDAVRRCLSYLEQYMTYWSVRAKPTPIGVEYLLTGAIPGIAADRTARLDDVGRYPECQGKLCLGELKTTSVSIKDCVQEYELHGQPMKQWVLWKLSPEGESRHGPAEHILLDVVVKGYGKERCDFGRVPIRVYDYAAKWYMENLARSVTIAKSLTKDSVVPRNITSCTRLIGRMRVDCTYKSLCRQGAPAATAYVDETGSSIARLATIDGPKPWD